jgi:tripartite-type tricarboxylate transporter receptor subunit TctC
MRNPMGTVMDVRMLGKTSFLCLCVAFFAVRAEQARSADDAGAAFYQGKQMRIVIGEPAGGGIDLLTRTVARHIGKHIPGNPTLVPENMPGAGSRVAANWLYNVATKDGSVIGMISQGAPLDQARKEPGIQYDVARFNWLGNPLMINGIMLTWRESGLTTVDEIRQKGGLICGASGASSPSYINPQMLKTLTNADIKIILGYPGNNDRLIAMQRGELNCTGGINMSTAGVTFADPMKNHKLAVIVQYGTEKDPAISAYEGREVPIITDLAKNDLDRNALNLINSGITFGRPILAPPDVPAERVAVLRRAFDETMKDRDFLEDAARQKIEINPIDGTHLQRLAEEIARATGAVVDRATAFLATQEAEKKP